MAHVYRKKDNLLTRKVAGETLIIPIRGALADLQRIYALDPVAECVWNRLGETTATDDLYAEVLDQFEMDEERVRKDVDEFIDQLLKADLIEKELT